MFFRLATLQKYYFTSNSLNKINESSKSLLDQILGIKQKMSVERCFVVWPNGETLYLTSKISNVWKTLFDHLGRTIKHIWSIIRDSLNKQCLTIGHVKIYNQSFWKNFKHLVLVSSKMFVEWFSVMLQNDKTLCLTSKFKCLTKIVCARALSSWREGLLLIDTRAYCSARQIENAIYNRPIRVACDCI